MVLLAFGSQIKEINGRLVTEAIKNESSNNLELKKDIQNGFILIDPKEGNLVSPDGKTKSKHQQKTDSQIEKIEKAIQQLPKPQFISLQDLDNDDINIVSTPRKIQKAPYVEIDMSEMKFLASPSHTTS